MVQFRSYVTSGENKMNTFEHDALGNKKGGVKDITFATCNMYVMLIKRAFGGCNVK